MKPFTQVISCSARNSSISSSLGLYGDPIEVQFLVNRQKEDAFDINKEEQRIRRRP